MDSLRDKSEAQARLLKKRKLAASARALAAVFCHRAIGPHAHGGRDADRCARNALKHILPHFSDSVSRLSALGRDIASDLVALDEQLRESGRAAPVVFLVLGLPGECRAGWVGMEMWGVPCAGARNQEEAWDDAAPDLKCGRFASLGEGDDGEGEGKVRVIGAGVAQEVDDPGEWIRAWEFAVMEALQKC